MLGMDQTYDKAQPAIRHDGWTLVRQRIFIEALYETGSVEAAAEAADMSASSAYRLRRRPGGEAFRIAWDNAVYASFERLSDVAMDRALNGVEVPVVAKGEIIGHRTVHNDRLLMFLLRHRLPLRYSRLTEDTRIIGKTPPDARDSLYESMDEIAPLRSDDQVIEPFFESDGETGSLV